MEIWEGYSQKGLAVKETDVEYFDIRQPPFQIYGACSTDRYFSRLPEDTAKAASGGVHTHALAAAGIRLRFATDSPYVAIKVEHAAYNSGSPHVTKLASVGFDLYIEKNGRTSYVQSFLPPLDTETGYEGIRYIGERGNKELLLCFPYGKQIRSLQVGLKKGSRITNSRPYSIQKPVVFYGSSITQGIAASRPGNAYENMISRRLNIDYINLGFSGSALGEPALAEYIAGLDMAAFVMDYDYNAPDAAYLQKTHEPFFKIVRERHPLLPVLFVTKPDAVYTEEAQQRCTVVMQTFLNARNRGDSNVFFIDGDSLFPEAVRADCTVDGTHPNDLGFHFMAERIGGILKNLLF